MKFLPSNTLESITNLDISSKPNKIYEIDYPKKPDLGFDIHDALDLWGIQGVHDGLPLGYLQLRLTVSDSGGNLGRVGQVLVVAKRVDGAPFSVLPDVIVAELACHPQKRSV